ncbi:protein spinster homolog 2 [Neolamprologus brichardi]|uniref:protein spinster homolog 2 n=1 Tax=Neolamprologus brichardi TaxID=32507 RepID=UPI0003EC618B|nr:protein spinster homolog 2 [Neolamprologus brichardi]
MCVESDGCEIEGCSSSDEVRTLSGSMSPGLKSNPDLHPCRPGQKFRAALLKCRSPAAAAGILSFGNVLNYMDRYTVAGVVLDIQRNYDVSDSRIGLLQTVFICSFMVAAPIFGYLGDRFNRKVILSCGIFFWSIVTLLSSFISKEYFWLFVLSRGLVGIGESSYSSISPTIIGDLFTSNTRTMMLSVFYLAIPLGSRSYVFSSLASAAVSFATGAFGIWIPGYLFRARVVQKTAEACTKEICSSTDSMVFGAITCVTGLLGVVIGALTTRLCRQKTERADPLVCAVSMLGSAIFICLIFVVAKKSIIGAYVCIFIGETLLFLNWAITADILMFVVIPTRRATAVAFQSFTSHLLGDAGSPYLIGLISDALQQKYTTSALWRFLSLGYALMLCPFIIVLGGMFFLATALYFLDDKDKAEAQCNQATQPPSSVKVTSK